jgi:hypothetical protein
VALDLGLVQVAKTIIHQVSHQLRRLIRLFGHAVCIDELTWGQRGSGAACSPIDLRPDVGLRVEG